ncbi:hypothetical protein JCM10296v2_007424 [Rhodotorula toruloides]
MAKTAHTACDGPLPHARDPPDAPEAVSATPHPDSPPFSSPTLPLELIKDILELCWNDRTAEGKSTVLWCCHVSRTHLAAARPIIWRKVRIQCKNVVKPHQPGHDKQMKNPYSSSSCWRLDSSSRRRLLILSERVDLRSFIRLFDLWPPNGVFRTDPATMWVNDFALIQAVVSNLPAVVSLGIAWIRDPDHLYLRPPAQGECLRILTARHISIDVGFAKSFPNLRQVNLQSFFLLDILPRDLAPPVESLWASSLQGGLSKLLHSFAATLRAVWFDDLAGLCWTDQRTNLLRSLARLESVTFTLRDLHTSTNEEDCRNPHRLFRTQGWLAQQLTEAVSLLDTLPRTKQVVLRLVRPPLADPKDQVSDRLQWQGVLRNLRKDGTWDALLPSTVMEVDRSGVFGEKEHQYR